MPDMTLGQFDVQYIFNAVADFDSDGIKDSVYVTKDASTGQWQALIAWMDADGVAQDLNIPEDAGFQATFSLSGDSATCLGLTVSGDMDGDYNADKLVLAMAPQMSSGGASEAWKAEFWQGDYKKRLYLIDTTTGIAHAATEDDIAKHGDWTSTATVVAF